MAGPLGTSSFNTSAPPDPIRVMVVDDSAVIRGLLTRTLETDPAIEVVVTVADGQMAVNALQRNDLDVIVLDIEMPVMDGLTALPKLIAIDASIKVVMASTLTHKNAEISLRALQAGAADYVTKPSSTRELGAADMFKRELIEKVKALGTAGRDARGGTRRVGLRRTSSSVKSGALPITRRVEPRQVVLRQAPPIRPDIIAVGSSTGGPQALFEVLSHMKGGVTQPILITQHMPATFTTILAEHIQRQCGIVCAEAREGEPVVGGRAYVAPGDFHMTVVNRGTGPVIALNKEPPENFCRPSVDPMMRSVTKLYGRNILAVILTGMGQDGLKGCEAVVAGGGMVIGQDEATSVVWGMPGAVATAGLCSAVLPLKDIGPYIRKTALRTAA